MWNFPEEFDWSTFLYTECCAKNVGKMSFNIAHQQTNFIILEIEDHLAPFILCVNNTLHDGQYIGVRYENDEDP